MNEAEKRALARAAEQFGTIGRNQARACGLSERQIDTRIANERWELLLPGVYRVRGTPPTTRQRLLATTLWAGDGSAISHLAAGRLLRLDAVPKPTMIDVSVPRVTGLASKGVVLHRTAIDQIDRVMVDGIRCTSATRTIIDLAARLDGEALEAAFESARRVGLTAPSALASRAAVLCGRGRAGSTLVRHLLAVLEHRPLESRLEVKTARLLRAHGLRAPANQLPVGRFRLDYAWPMLLLAVECDGFEHHGQRLLWKRDRRRIAELESMGWRLIHVTWDDVTNHPDETVSRIRSAVQRAVA